MNKYFAKYFIYGIGQFVRREPVMRYLAEFKKTQYMTLDDLKKMQGEKLVSTVEYAKKNIPYYKKSFDGKQLLKDDPLNSIVSFPTITKIDVRNNFENLTCEKSLSLLTKKTSGGSTGQAVIVLKDRKSTSIQRALMYRGYSWACIDIGDKQVRFWGVPINTKSKIKNKIIDYFMNRKRLSAFRFRDNDLKMYYEAISTFRPAYFYGYTSMLYEFALYVKKNNLDGKNLGISTIISTSEVLYETQRELMKDVFGCKVYNEYGCGEFGPVAFECEKGQMHINAENILVEILKNGKPAEPGEQGEIVLTELNNNAMPLIRYRMGDVGALSSSACSCGRALPVLKKITGRALDFIVNCSGQKVHGEYFNYLMEEIQNKKKAIKQFQIIQKVKGEIEFHIVKDTNFSDNTLQYINAQLEEIFGEDMVIKYIYDDEIKRLQSGKLRLVVSELQ
jgi:phenylacetate-CoA ligase